ncbi:hypothetical protein VP1G_03050 [Cytospora mali]|uniref:Amidoligase enzyme n=1 Tax=Cytospora mali TaxID=578113 RepID=A0A194UVJ7_CYTMA|nr:hypothetical protein VP1G_03050 [Valsa mali var. pyri (nom. inval.)]
MTSQTKPHSTSSLRDEAEDITFALEIKCLIRQELPKSYHLNNQDEIRPFVPHLPEESRNSMTDAEKQIQRSTWAAVAIVLHTLPGIRATTSHQIKEQNLSHDDFWKTHWIVYKANSAVPPYLSFENGDPNRPLLDTTAPDYDQYVWIPLEVCSPKLYWTQKDEALDSTGKVCEALRQRFGAISNHSCEVHVHIGRHDGLFFSLRSMKKLATLFWLSEPILRSLKHPRSRNFDHLYTWSFAWRQHSRIALALEADRNPAGGRTIEDLYTGKPDDFDAFLERLEDSRETSDTPDDHFHFVDEHRQALRAIWRASNHEELGRMLCGPDQKRRRLGFNFHSLAGEDERGRNSPRTIEFRFLEGFNDKDIVSGWVQVCISLAELAVDKTDDWGFYKMVVLLLKMPEHCCMDAKFIAMMQQLGLPKETYEPLRRVIRNNYPPDSKNRTPSVA